METPSPSFPCPGFQAEVRVERIKPSTHGEIAAEVDPNRYGLPSPELPLLRISSYGFGVLSVRLEVPVFLRRDFSLEETISGWIKLAASFREVIDSFFEGRMGSTLSNYYSEVYILEGNLASLDPQQVSKIIAPFKMTGSSFEVFGRGEHRDLLLVSTDGFMAQLFGRGGRWRDARRKMRRALRLVSDIALAQKVFFTNPVLWRMDEGSWAAMVGLVYLNPRLWKRGFIYPNRKLYSAFKRISSPFKEAVEEGAEAFFDTGYLMGVRTSDIPHLVRVTCRLGVGSLRLVPPSLSHLEAEVLSMLSYKHELDGRFRRSKYYLKKVVNSLCEEFYPDSQCLKELKRKLEARNDRTGLSVEEMEVLLGGSVPNPRGLLYKKGVLDSLIDKGLVRTKRVARRGRGPREVTIFYPEASSDFVSWLLTAVRSKISQRLTPDF